jgi:hypothetical protein
MYLDITPLLVPIPSLDGHIITASEDNRGSRMDSEASDIIRVSLECSDFFMGVVVEDAELVVV